MDDPQRVIFNALSDISCDHSHFSGVLLCHSFQLRHKLCAGNDFRDDFTSRRVHGFSEFLRVLYVNSSLLHNLRSMLRVLVVLGNHKSRCCQKISQVQSSKSRDVSRHLIKL